MSARVRTLCRHDGAHRDDRALGHKPPHEPATRYPGDRSPAEKRTGHIIGGWFLGTLVFSIPAFWFYDPLLDHAQYIVGSDRDTRVAFGALLEIWMPVVLPNHTNSCRIGMTAIWIGTTMSARMTAK